MDETYREEPTEVSPEVADAPPPAHPETAAPAEPVDADLDDAGAFERANEAGRVPAGDEPEATTEG